MATLADVAKIVRSKNAGPFLVTFDIMFKDEATFQWVRRCNCLNRDVIARLYQVRPEEVMFFEYPAAFAFKATIPRDVASGDPRDRDIYAAQQHILVANIEVPDRA